MQRVPDGRAQVQRRALEPHRRAASERRDAGDHARGEGAQRQRVLRVVKRLEILVGRCGADRGADPAQRERRDRETGQRCDRDGPQREPAERVEAVRDHRLERSDTDPGEHPDDGREHERLA